MAVSYEQLAQFCEALGYEHQMVGEGDSQTLKVAVPIKRQGEMVTLPIRLKAYDNGKMFEADVRDFIDPELLRSSENKAIFFAFLLHKAWQSKFGTPEMDIDDGEVRLLVEIPLIDAEMTQKQLEYILNVALRTAIGIGIEGKQVLETGKFPESADTAALAAAQQMLFAQMQALLMTEEGRGHLMNIANDENAPSPIREMARSLLEQFAARTTAATAVPDTL